MQIRAVGPYILVSGSPPNAVKYRLRYALPSSALVSNHTNVRSVRKAK